MKANIASVAAGLAADQKLSSREYYYYLINCFAVGIISCCKDSASKPEGALFPIRCEDINYLGKSCRSW